MELDCKETFDNYISCQKTAVVGPAEGTEKLFIATSLQACLVGIRQAFMPKVKLLS